MNKLDWESWFKQTRLNHIGLIVFLVVLYVKQRRAREAQNINNLYAH